MNFNKETKHILFILLFVIVTFSLKAVNPKAPYNLRCFDKINPVGTADNPYFGWFTSDPDDNEIQSAYHIIVSSSVEKLKANIGDLWDSGKIPSRKQNYIYYNGETLHFGTQYFWKVRIWDKDGNAGPYSAIANFSTGLFTNKDWSGSKWIKRNTDSKDDYTYYRKNLVLPHKKIKRATVYLTACHSYELYINGDFVGKGFNHNYPKNCTYNAWDITSYLKNNGDNLIACLTHWYGGGQGRAKSARGLLMKVVVEYSDSTSTVLGTDKSWKQTRATRWLEDQPQRNGEGIGHIEAIDSRKAIAKWNQKDFDDKTWDNAVEIGVQPCEPWTGNISPDLTRVKEEEIKPVSVTKLSDKKYVVDLGKIYAGTFKIDFKGGISGDTIKMTGGFVLNEDGTVSRKINQNTNLDFVFIHNGDKSEFKTSVYLGLRYLEIENSPNVLNNGNVSFISRHYELNSSNAEFESSDTTLNKVWNLMEHSLIVGAQEGFLDTPTREKGTFLDDSWLQADPDLTVLYDRTMNNLTLNEFLKSQDQYWPDGRLNAVYPNCDGGRDIPDFTQAYLVWVWDYYMQTGNVEFLKSNYFRLKKVADYVASCLNKETGLIHKLNGGKGPYRYGIVDWPADMRYGYDMRVESRTVIDAYAYADFDIVSKIAGVLGMQKDQIQYADEASLIKDAMNSQLINETGVYVDGLYKDYSSSKHVSQHANILPFALGITPEKYKVQVVREIKEKKMSVGMICARWLPDAIGKADDGEHLLNLYTNTEWDGWANTLTKGATVTWESWNAMDKNESLSHPWGASGLLGIQNYILGVKTLAAQNDTIQIRPLDFGNKLSFVKGIYNTDKGAVFVHWEKSNDSYTLSVKIPDNVVALVYIPNCGKNTDVVLLDNKEVNGRVNGGYIYIGNIGSGEHLIKR